MPPEGAPQQGTDRSAAAAGLAAVGLFALGSALTGGRPAFDASGPELAAYIGEHRTQLQVGTLALAAAVPPLVWFLATPVGRGREANARRLAVVALACGLAFVTLFLADVTTIAVSALRPESMLADPQLALSLRDFEFLVMGAAAPLVSATLACFAGLALRHGMWPRPVGWLALAAAFAYLLRAGTLFTDDGALAADGLLGIYVPAGALIAWLLAACASELLRARR